MREEAGGGQKKEVRGSEWNCGGESGHTRAVAIVGVGIRTDGSRAHVVWWCGGVRRLVVVVMARYFAPRQCRSRAHRIAYQGSRVCAGAARALQCGFILRRGFECAVTSRMGAGSGMLACPCDPCAQPEPLISDDAIRGHTKGRVAVRARGAGGPRVGSCASQGAWPNAKAEGLLLG